MVETSLTTSKIPGGHNISESPRTVLCPLELQSLILGILVRCLTSLPEVGWWPNLPLAHARWGSLPLEFADSGFLFPMASIIFTCTSDTVDAFSDACSNVCFSDAHFLFKAWAG